MTVTQEHGDMNDCEWMITRFKVLPCTRKGAHSWTECPFVHPGEKAARRCPLTHIYSADPCPDARKSGKCARGDACPYSHGVFEQWLHPSRFRTQLCSFGSACRRPICFFAHSVTELRVPTACGPNAGAACPPNPALLAGAYTDPSTAAYAAAAAAGRSDAAQVAALQQALLSQMNSAASSMQQLDGATATMINRYQAASCAALANAAACQRQQQQHQAAAAAAAAAAIAAAANSSPASLLQMVQAAQAYQAAAAAAAAAAASIHLPRQQQQMMGSTPQSGNSNISNSTTSSPTSSSHNYSLASVSTCIDPQDRCIPGDVPIASSAMAAAAAAANGQGYYDSYVLQQALAAAKATSSGLQMPVVSTATPMDGPSGLLGMNLNNSPWSLPTSGAPSFLGGSVSPFGCASGFATAGSGGFAGGYPSGMMPATPDVGDGGASAALAPSCGSLDALANQLSRQLSLAAYQG